MLSNVRFDPLWKKVMGYLSRIAVRVIFVGPDAEPDPRLQRAKDAGNMRPMDPAFFEAVKDFLALAEEKGRQWSQVIKPRADAAMSAVWEKLWKTPEGRSYQDLKVQVDRRKAQVDAVCKRAEDGISRKILSSGQVVTFIKTTVLVGKEDLIDRARNDLERLKYELAEAKKRLKQLEKGKEDSLERLNVLVVEPLKGPAKPKAARPSATFRSRMAGDDEIRDAIVASSEIDDLMADELMAVERVLDEALAGLEALAAETMTPEELDGLAPKDDEVPVTIED